MSGRMPADRRDREGERRPAFGPLDPWCLLAVGPLAIAGAVLLFSALPPVGVLLLLFGAGILLLDLRVNRPEPGERRRPRRR